MTERTLLEVSWKKTATPTSSTNFYLGQLTQLSKIKWFLEIYFELQNCIKNFTGFWEDTSPEQSASSKTKQALY